MEHEISEDVCLWFLHFEEIYRPQPIRLEKIVLFPDNIFLINITWLNYPVDIIEFLECVSMGEKLHEDRSPYLKALIHNVELRECIINFY